MAKLDKLTLRCAACERGLKSRLLQNDGIFDQRISPKNAYLKLALYFFRVNLNCPPNRSMVLNNFVVTDCIKNLSV